MLNDIQKSLEKNGILPDKPDFRDIPVGIAASNYPLPSRVDNRDKCSIIKSQSARGTCGSFTGVAALEYYNRQELNQPDLDLSEQFFYDWCKKIDGYDGYGTYGRVVAKVATDHGACLEAMMPYEPNSPEDITKIQEPTEPANQNALQYRMKSYAYIGISVEDLKRAVNDFGIAMTGWKLYGNYGEAINNGGWFSLPADRSKEYGHFMACIGYDDDLINPHTQEKGHFIIRNSWGLTGDKGYYFIPYSYVRSPHAFSFYTFIDLTNLTMPKPFPDIPAGFEWAWEALQFLKDKGYLVGIGGNLGMTAQEIRQVVLVFKILKGQNLI